MGYYAIKRDHTILIAEEGALKSQVECQQYNLSTLMEDFDKNKIALEQAYSLNRDLEAKVSETESENIRLRQENMQLNEKFPKELDNCRKDLERFASLNRDLVIKLNKE